MNARFISARVLGGAFFKRLWSRSFDSKWKKEGRMDRVVLGKKIRGCAGQGRSRV